MEHQLRIGIFRPDIQDGFSDVPLLPEIFLWNDQKSRVPFTSQPDFPETFCKQPLLVLERFSIFNYSTLRDGKRKKKTGGMADECVKYHSRLADLISNRKGESYSSAISWIRAKVSFAISRSAILCLRGSRSRRRQLDFVDSDLQIENIRACPN